MAAGTSQAGQRGGFALSAVAVWIVLATLYVAFVGSLSLDEAVAGAPSAALGCLWWVRAGRRGGVRFAGWEHGLRPLGTALFALPGATIRIGSQLVRTLAGHTPLGTVAYRHGSDTAWARAASPSVRAVGLVAASLAPDSYVLREKAGDGGILDHAILREKEVP